MSGGVFKSIDIEYVGGNLKVGYSRALTIGLIADGSPNVSRFNKPLNFVDEIVDDGIIEEVSVDVETTAVVNGKFARDL